MHSAFVLRAEGRLEKSEHYGKHLPRGELVELLSKALLYSEAEAHWKGNAMTSNCKAPFSILKRHVCALDPTLPPTVTFQTTPVFELDVPVVNGTSEKRKASTPPPTEATPKEKRARTEEMEVDSVTSAERTFTPSRCDGSPVRLFLRVPTLAYLSKNNLQTVVQPRFHKRTM